MYTAEEKKVLCETSYINNNWFHRFTDVNCSEKFQYDNLFEDRASKLKLSSEQASEFERWVRLNEICSNPKIVVGEHVDCLCIKQAVSVCFDSLLSSLYVQLLGTSLP